jgi:hypothetical protein
MNLPGRMLYPSRCFKETIAIQAVLEPAQTAASAFRGGAGFRLRCPLSEVETAFAAPM